MKLEVLAVDDSRTIRDMIRLTLTAENIGVTLAEDGVDGMSKLADAAPDAIITDINMPNMDGFEFIQSVRSDQKHRSTPILVLTTEHGMEMKARARSAGATGWIVKPFDPAKLVKAIRMVAG